MGWFIYYSAGAHTLLHPINYNWYLLLSYASRSGHLAVTKVFAKDRVRVQKLTL